MHTALRIGMQVARKVRALNPDAHVCFHGLYATLHENHLRGELADSLLGGEHEEALVAIVRRLATERRPAAARLARAPRKTGNGSSTILRKLDFPVPSRQALPPLDRYAKIDDGRTLRLAGHVEATRGCLHHCRHCPIPAVYQGRFFVVPVPVVLDDVRQQVQAGATHVTFGDADFLNGPTHALRVARAIHAEFPSLTMDFTAKVEHLLRHESMLPGLASLGVVFVVTAVESLSDVVLGNLRKGHTSADARLALRALRNAGITMRPSFLPFTPWSTLEDYFELLDWIEMDDLVDCVDPVQLTIRLLVPPGSLLLESPEMTPFLGPFDPEKLTHTWNHPDPGLDRLQALAAQVVEHAAGHREDPRVTFGRLRALAVSIRGGEVDRFEPTLATTGAGATTPAHRRARAPRLTEPWFC
jgi:radical SAM superfamily enzyme YgiQ (UPF0313 family)